MEDIIINVPKGWSDIQKEDLACKLEELGLPSDVRVLITNKMDVKYVDVNTMDSLRGNTSNGDKIFG